ISTNKYVLQASSTELQNFGSKPVDRQIKFATIGLRENGKIPSFLFYTSKHDHLYNQWANYLVKIIGRQKNGLQHRLAAMALRGLAAFLNKLRRSACEHSLNSR